MMELPSRKRRRRPKRRSLDGVREDMQIDDMTEEDEEDRGRGGRNS